MLKYFVVGMALVLQISSVVAEPLGTPTPGYVYFHKTGADWAKHNADVDQCAVIASESLSPVVVGFGGLLSGLVRVWQQKGVAHVNFAANLENCMVVRGWDVVRLPDAEGQRIVMLSQQQIASALAPWVGSGRPEGVIVRQYEPVDKLSIRAAGPYDTALDSLSVLADADPISSSSTPPMEGDSSPSWNMIKPAESPLQIPADFGVVVLRIATVTPAQSWIMFGNFKPDPTTHLISLFNSGSLHEFLSRDKYLEKTLTFLVPTGRWQIVAVRGPGFCLGTPAFDLHSGEVLFAGNYDATHPFELDMSQDKVRASLGNPELISKLKPAQYMNGTTYDCKQFPETFEYVLELPSVPFVSGYVSGSRATAAGQK